MLLESHFEPAKTSMPAMSQHSPGRARQLTAQYDGYTSCPIILKYGSLMLTEFKYGGEPSETFGPVWDQSNPTWFFYR